MTSPLIAAISVLGIWPKREVEAYPMAQEAPALPPREARLFADTREDERKRRDALFAPFPYTKD
jgi:hypothetical protein